MLDKETLLEMIKEQEQTVQKAKEQLKKLYTLATELNINVEKVIFDSPQTSVKLEMEAKRKELIDKIDKIRKEALAQTQQAMSVAQSGISSIANVPGMYGTGNLQNTINMPSKNEFIKMTENLKSKNEKK
ncbi:MAG: hypothetical protein WC516_08275 [Patescibacteria group bacterium]